MFDRKNEKAEAPKLNVRCRNCVFFDKRSEAWGDQCKKLGILPHASPCKKFTVDHTELSLSEKGVRLISRALVRIRSDKVLEMLTAVLSQESKTRAHGFRFGQQVYLRMFGSDYISNYGKARVIRADAEYVYVEGLEGFRAMLYHESVMTLEAWEEKFQSLKEKGKEIDPDIKEYTETTPKRIKDSRNLPEISSTKEPVKHKSRELKKLVRLRG